MGVTDYSWGPAVQLEANRCWFYALIASILVTVYNLMELYFSLAVGTATTENQSGAKKAATSADPTNDIPPSRLLTDLAIDCCDIVLPGTAVGWIPASQFVVGSCQSISSILAGRRIWDRVNARAR